MKVVILAGGLPSKLMEEDEKIPKPMAELGNKPIIWHIMKQYAHYGFDDFIICGGYKVNMLKDYFKNYYLYQSDITVDLSTNNITIHNKNTENWRVTVVDTGFNSSIPQRLLAVRHYLNEDFIVTYGDCVSNINIADMVTFHKDKNKIATLAVANPIGRNEILPIENEAFINEAFFRNEAWVNACNMIFKKDIFNVIDENMRSEQELFDMLLRKQIAIPYIHKGFWSPMETIRDQRYLQYLWNTDQAPWKVWG